VDFKGTVQCDGYSAYRSFANSATALNWPAAGRMCGKFHEALEQSPKTAGWILRQIQHLYRWKPGCANKRPAPDCARRFAPIKANPSSNA
jgi:transposase